ncbi:MAG: hypothetical protein KF760_04595 [Candidatus Eremiobacteraeota bacterium]|nr:hypothetical protein [Candidatus Eremiobacteraeota bacterium]MCW5866952.1 hypothetical protein [Candidatus Eremiobacteraeota bacterium]
MQGLANVIYSLQPQGDLEFMREWQREVVAAARALPGFRDSEEFPQVPGLQDRWVLVLRFQSDEGLQAWLESPRRRELYARGAPLSPHQEVVCGPGSSARPVTLMVSTRVPPESAERFRAWQLEFLEVQKASPGYLGTEYRELGNDWTIAVRFDCQEHADAFMVSPERLAMLKKIETALHGQRRLVLDFGGWFEVVAQNQGRPPGWKQMLSVLIAIYPIVMLTMRYVDPQLVSWRNPLPVAVLRDNVLSCSLLTWVVMPRLTSALNFWLQPAEGQPAWLERAGTFGVLLVLLVEVLLFLYWGA